MQVHETIRMTCCESCRAVTLCSGVQARTIIQLKDCLAKGGPEGLLRHLYEDYVLQRAAAKGKSKGALSRGAGSGRGSGRGRTAKGSGGR